MRGFSLMAFDIFQTESATLRKVGVDNFGNVTNLESYSCRIDPTLGKEVRFDKDGEQVRGRDTVLDGLPELDQTHDRWELDFRGRKYNVERLTGMPAIGSNKPQHYEVLLR